MSMVVIHFNNRSENYIIVVILTSSKFTALYISSSQCSIFIDLNKNNQNLPTLSLYTHCHTVLIYIIDKALLLFHSHNCWVKSKRNEKRLHYLDENLIEFSLHPLK